MKKLLFTVAIFATMLANATNDTEVVTNTLQDVTIEKNDVLADINFEEVSVNANENSISEAEVLFGCGSQGNAEYDRWRDEGYSHREARELRRAFVRDCRDFPDGGWLEIIIFGIRVN